MFYTTSVNIPGSDVQIKGGELRKCKTCPQI